MAYGKGRMGKGAKSSKMGGRSANQMKKKTKKKVHGTQSTRRGY